MAIDAEKEAGLAAIFYWLGTAIMSVGVAEAFGWQSWLIAIGSAIMLFALKRAPQIEV